MPCTTYSWKASLTKGVGFAAPAIRLKLVSFSVNNDSRAPAKEKKYSPRSSCLARLVAVLPFDGRACKSGLSFSGHHAQVLRNHNVGSTCNVAVSGPRL